MRWSVLDNGVDAGRIAAAHEIPLVPTSGADVGDGVILVGDDRALSDLAAAVPPDLPILFVPKPGSDLARMFRFDQTGVRARMAHGASYRADLGIAGGAKREVPFVAHAVLSRTGRLRPWWARRRPVEIERKGRADLRAVTTVVLANAQHLDGSTVAPRAALMDGRGEMQCLEGSPLGRAAALRRMDRGLHLGLESVHRRSFEVVGLGAPPSWHLVADGQDAGPGPWYVRIEAGAYTLWV